jgi:hypothetical protein
MIVTEEGKEIQLLLANSMGEVREALLKVELLIKSQAGSNTSEESTAVGDIVTDLHIIALFFFGLDSQISEKETWLYNRPLAKVNHMAFWTSRL